MSIEEKCDRSSPRKKKSRTGKYEPPGGSFEIDKIWRTQKRNFFDDIQLSFRDINVTSYSLLDSSDGHSINEIFIIENIRDIIQKLRKRQFLSDCEVSFVLQFGDIPMNRYLFLNFDMTLKELIISCMLRFNIFRKGIMVGSRVRLSSILMQNDGYDMFVCKTNSYKFRKLAKTLIEFQEMDMLIVDLKEFNDYMIFPLNLHMMLNDGNYYSTTVWSENEPEDVHCEKSKYMASVCYIKFSMRKLKN